MPTRNRATKDPAYEAGLAVRRRVLGEAHVNRALENATEFDADFQAMITRHAWGDIWTRPGLDLRLRSLITIAILAALGRGEELDLHVRATRNTGATPDDVKEVLMQVAVYAGVPAANSAFRIAKAALAEMAKERSR
jgi:4-carboxymuconolactone decarboxylase